MLYDGICTWWLMSLMTTRLKSDIHRSTLAIHITLFSIPKRLTLRMQVTIASVPPTCHDLILLNYQRPDERIGVYQPLTPLGKKHGILHQ